MNEDTQFAGVLIEGAADDEVAVDEAEETPTVALQPCL